MLKHLSRTQTIAVWFSAVALAVAATLVAGVVATPGTWALLMLVSLVPPALSLVIWQDPPQTVHEVLYVARQGQPRI